MHFSIEGSTGFIRIEIKEVFGFPNQTSHFGGYDTESTIALKSNGFSVKSDFWDSTGKLYDLYQCLKKTHSELHGDVKFTSSEYNLSFVISYNNVGHVTIKGEFKEDYPESNLLQFEIVSDQSYLNKTLTELRQIVRKYGDNTGKTDDNFE